MGILRTFFLSPWLWCGAPACEQAHSLADHCAHLGSSAERRAPHMQPMPLSRLRQTSRPRITSRLLKPVLANMSMPVDSGASVVCPRAHSPATRTKRCRFKLLLRRLTATDSLNRDEMSSDGCPVHS